MSILGHLGEKPWLAGEDSVVELRPRHSIPIPSAKVGLWVFLAAITVLFSLLAIAYTERMFLPDWRPLPDPGLLWFNTLVLIFSSIALQRARVAARRGRIVDVKNGLLVGGVFAIVFLTGQFWASQQLAELGYYAASNPANAFFYLITGLHALHLAGGLVAWARTAAKVRRGFKASQVALSVELCAIYWHFLLLVWLILFTLMVFS